MIAENQAPIKAQRTWQVLRMDEVVVGDVVDTSRPGINQITRVEGAVIDRGAAPQWDMVILTLDQAAPLVAPVDMTIDVYR